MKTMLGRRVGGHVLYVSFLYGTNCKAIATCLEQLCGLAGSECDSLRNGQHNPVFT